MRTSTRTALGSLLAVGLLAAPGADGASQEEAPEEREERIESRAVTLAPGHAAPARPGGGYLGVAIDDVDQEGADELGLQRVRGVRVTDVREDAPASEAGVRADDVIVRFDGEEVRSARQLVRLVRETPPDRRVEVELLRDGDRRTVEVRVGERPSGWPGLDEERMERIRERVEGAMERHGDAMERLKELRVHRDGEEFDIEVRGMPHGIFGDRGRLGVRLQRLTDQLADHFGVDGGGALVASVRDGSPAGDAGLRAGDVIVGVGGEDVHGPAAVARAVRESEAGPVTVELVRDGDRRSVTVELPERDGGEEVGLGHRPPGAPSSASAGSGPAPAVPSAPPHVPAPAPPAAHSVPPVPPAACAAGA